MGLFALEAAVEARPIISWTTSFTTSRTRAYAGLLMQLTLRAVFCAGAEWDWLRGALSTVDRSHGILDHFFHHIADTHVCHHLFSYMPFYNATEATKHLRMALGDYYLKDDRNVWLALWDDFQECEYVAPDKKGEGVLWYRKQGEMIKG